MNRRHVLSVDMRSTFQLLGAPCCNSATDASKSCPRQRENCVSDGDWKRCPGRYDLTQFRVSRSQELTTQAILVQRQRSARLPTGDGTFDRFNGSVRTTWGFDSPCVFVIRKTPRPRLQNALMLVKSPKQQLQLVNPCHLPPTRDNGLSQFAPHHLLAFCRKCIRLRCLLRNRNRS